MSGTYALILDSMIVILLVAMIVYSVILNRRLAALRNNRSEMEQAVRHFGDAAIRADESIRALKANSDQAGQTLQAEVQKAQTLRDEIKFLVEAGERLADRLESAAGRSGDVQPNATLKRHKATQVAAQAQTDEDAGSAAKGEARSERSQASGERKRGVGDVDLLRAIENMR